MECDLKILDSLIVNKLDPVKLNEAHSENDFSEWLAIAEKVHANYPSNFFTEILSFQDVKLIKKHVQCHQARLIFLSDKLYFFISLNKKKSKKYCGSPLSFVAIQKSVYFILEELLNFLQHQFPKHFKLLHIVPKKQNKSIKEKFKGDIQKLKNRLVAGENKLWEIAFQPYEEFIKSERKSLCYQEIDYLQELLNELELIPGSSLFNRDDELLKNTLFQNNFNSWSFFYYLSDEIKDTVQLEETQTGQLEKYYWHQKVINQTIIDYFGQSVQ